jgi:choline transport protein
MFSTASHSLTSASRFSAFAFEAVLFVFMFFPVAPNPDAQNFNWTTLVFLVVLLWAVGYYYVWGKKKYAGPVTHVKTQDY